MSSKKPAIVVGVCGSIGASIIRNGDLLTVDGGEVVYVAGMTVGDYFGEAIVSKYKPRVRGRVTKTDNRPYYRKLEKRHKRN